jgi:transposase-like protein
MGDRFYEQQLKATGDCPGASKSQKRKGRKMAWTDEKKAEAIKLYEDAEPTPENSMEIVKEVADQLDETPNGVRMILSKAGVYVKKAAAAKASGGESKKGGSKRVSKEDAQNALREAIQGLGLEPDEDIITKMTGKAAQYITSVIKSSQGKADEAED